MHRSVVIARHRSTAWKIQNDSKSWVSLHRSVTAYPRAKYVWCRWYHNMVSSARLRVDSLDDGQSTHVSYQYTQYYKPASSIQHSTVHSP